MKVLSYPETRQTFTYDCGSNALASMLCYGGAEEREDRLMKLAGTTERDGTPPDGVLLVFGYFGLPTESGEGMTPDDLRKAIDKGFPTMLCLQAYRDSNKPYSQLWDQGHWVVAIGYDKDRIIMEDPASYHRTWISDTELIERWHDEDKGKKVVGWGCTLLVNGAYQHDQIDHLD